MIVSTAVELSETLRTRTLRFAAAELVEAVASALIVDESADGETVAPLARNAPEKAALGVSDAAVPGAITRLTSCVNC